MGQAVMSSREVRLKTKKKHLSRKFQKKLPIRQLFLDFTSKFIAKRGNLKNKYRIFDNDNVIKDAGDNALFSFCLDPAHLCCTTLIDRCHGTTEPNVTLL